MKRPLKGKMVAKLVDKGERVTQDGIIILDDDGKEQGIRHRWFQVKQTHPEETEDVKPGDYVLVEHGRWTRKIQLQDQEFWIIESKGIMAKNDYLPKTL
tara:strand:+ start:1637 stop:1933 length:297 start_codon:yes stop_codon:yes gene_type:complete